MRVKFKWGWGEVIWDIILRNVHGSLNIAYCEAAEFFFKNRSPHLSAARYAVHLASNTQQEKDVSWFVVSRWRYEPTEVVFLRLVWFSLRDGVMFLPGPGGFPLCCREALQVRTGGGTAAMGGSALLLRTAFEVYHHSLDVMQCTSTTPFNSS
jgi:hypothetical protein